MSHVFRAPIRLDEYSIEEKSTKENRQDKEKEKEKENEQHRTRCGYLVPEAYACYEATLGETGAISSGKLLHFAADLVCSGGLDIWIRGAYSYAFQHINLANPRIFVYLRQRIHELDEKAARLPQESFYSNPEVQSIIAEVVLVLQICAKRAKIVWPKVDDSTKRPGWLRGVAGAPETRVTRIVWTSDGDTPPLYLVANELCKAVTEGSTEKALFWIRWVWEEDVRVRKETNAKHGLSTKERGVVFTKGQGQGQKARTEVGHFIADILSEIYKEHVSKGIVRMNEEFSELMRLWRGGEQRMPARFRKESLALMAMICCEVPRWKVPAAPSLVPDPVRLSRAVGQAGSFFQEVLAYQPLATGLKASMMKAKAKAKVKEKKDLTDKEKKDISFEEHNDAYDLVMEAYLNRQ
jgi:hypothetical protein